jgi:acylphosphatase
LVARLLREQEVAGSNPVAPTIAFSRGTGRVSADGQPPVRAMCEAGEERHTLSVVDMNAAAGQNAAEILVEGRVQGVGYRNFVQRKAAQLGLAGYVMNLKNGKVRVRVEGGREAIEELARELTKGPPLAKVDSLGVTWRPPTGRFTSFGVRYAEFD